MKKISLSQDKFALIDDDDFECVSQFKWYSAKRGNTYYAVSSLPRNGGEVKKQYLHRFILKPDSGKEVDHINGNGLDNRKSNLRVCTRQQNTLNRGRQRNNSSGHKGISWDKTRQKFAVYAKLNGKRTFLGRHSEFKEAVSAYRAFAKQFHGEFINL